MNYKTQFAFCLGVAALACISAGIMAHRSNRQVGQYQEYVMKHAPHKYNELARCGSRLTWEEAAKQVQDSIKLDSVARTNYAKGQRYI